MHWERLMSLQPHSQSRKPLSKERMGTQQLDSGLDSLRRYAQFRVMTAAELDFTCLPVCRPCRVQTSCLDHASRGADV